MTTSKTAGRLELRGVRTSVGRSEKSPAYEARIYLDGFPFACVSNDGQGRKDKLAPVDGVGKPQFAEKLATARSLVDGDLDDFCHAMVAEFIEKRNLQSALSRNVVAHVPGKGLVKVEKSPRAKSRLRREYGDEVRVLNEMPTSQALEFYRGHQAA